MKNLIVFLILISTSVFGQVPSYYPTNGLISLWELNNNLNASTIAFNGTFSNLTGTFDRNGNPNMAMRFTGQNSFATLPFTVMAQCPYSFTISIWAKPDSIQPSIDGHELINDRSILGWNYRFRIGFSYGGNNPNFSVDSLYMDRITNNGQIEKMNVQGPNIEEWVHYVLTYDTTSFSTGLLKAYRNGVLVNSRITIGPVFGNRAINIGRTFHPNTTTAGSAYYIGSLDDIGIWNRALDSTEIALLYSGCSFSILNQPTSQTTTPNSSVQFTVSTTANVQKQWQMAPASTGVFSNIVNGVNFIGVDSSVLTVRNISSQFNNAQFRCVLTDSVCSTTTTAATLAVNCWDLTSSVPSPATISVGDSAQFSIQSSVPGSQFQWQVYLGNVWNNLADFGQYAGTTTPTLRVRNINYSNHRMRFRCLVSNSGCNDTSGVGEISVLCEPIISRQPQNTTTRINQAAYFHVDTIPGASYQWQRNIGLGFVSLTNGSEFQGVNQPRLMLINALMLDDNSAFRCIVNFAHCQDTSDFAILNVDWGVSTPEIKVTKFYAYPNPAQTTLFINYPDIHQSEEFKFINSLGQVVHTATLQHEHTELDISGLAEGTYTLISGTSRLKIVILKP